MAPTRTLHSCLALAPKLARLEYLGDDYNSITFEQIPYSPTQLPPLTEVILCCVDINETALIGGLWILCKTLNRLALENVELVSGSWRTVFRFIRKTLCLRFLDLGGLRCNEKLIHFGDLLSNRPVVLDAELAKARSTMWHWALWANPPAGHYTSEKYKAKTKELDEVTAADWVWVAHNTGANDYIILDAEEGDDVMEWVALVEEQHQVT
jgi:hypothetical protein